VPVDGYYQELLNTDLAIYAGSGQGNFANVSSENTPWQGQPHRINVTVPPMATVMFSLSGVI